MLGQGDQEKGIRRLAEPHRQCQSCSGSGRFLKGLWSARTGLGLQETSGGRWICPANKQIQPSKTPSLCHRLNCQGSPWDSQLSRLSRPRTPYSMLLLSGATRGWKGSRRRRVHAEGPCPCPATGNSLLPIGLFISGRSCLLEHSLPHLLEIYLLLTCNHWNSVLLLLLLF